MKASERPKKPRLKRTKPVRAWSGIFADAEAPATPARGQEASARKAPSRVRAEDTNGSSGIPEAVKLGYTVLQDYLDEARQEAQRLTGSQPGAGGAPDPQRLTQRLFQYTSDLTNLWLEILQTATQRDVRREPPRGTAGPFRNAHASAESPYDDRRDAPVANASATSTTTPGALVRIVAARPVAVSVELKPGPIAGPLVAHELRCSDPDAPRLDGVELEFQAASNRVCVAIRVPDDLPDGVYSGLFIDTQDNLPRGMLSVAVQSSK